MSGFLNLPTAVLAFLAKRLHRTSTLLTTLPTPPSDHAEDSLTHLLSQDLPAPRDLPIPLPPDVERPKEVLPTDLRTPDSKVARDPRLIRLTGVHPFNSESPLSPLLDSGFLTPSALFYVRNHGAAPMPTTSALDWTISISGLVERPFTISLRELISKYEQVTVPITLVCAGNRRSEQNRVRKSQGFSWGSAGVSTSLFTGMLLGEVLKSAGILRSARYVCMEGADQLPHGEYATSLRLSMAMNNDAGVMLAYGMNGEELMPDHGWPLRVVVPGCIGGRSVKWIKRLIVTAKPSASYYHLYDNRVLPTMVTPEMAGGEDGKFWWQDERYAIYELSVNSAVVYPAHDEVMEMVEGGIYTIKGYAYAGGGRRVSRVEVSLDKGRTWLLTTVSYPEDKYREIPEGTMLYGGRLDVARRDTCFCWCFWELEVPVTSLGKASDIVVRAMDEGMAVQPRDQYWSVLGMMNSSWHRVAIRKEDGNMRRFEHPTLPAMQKGGWMDRVLEEGGDLLGENWGEKQEGVERTAVPVKPREEVSMTNDAVTRIITMEELEAHNDANEPWFVVNGQVYDGTGFLDDHPGGPTSIISAAGQDATDEFVAIHSERARAMMPAYHIGTLSPTAKFDILTPPTTPSPVFLNPRAWRQTKLLKVQSISPDTRIFTFALDSPTQPLGLPVGQHLMLKISTPNGNITRPYTPISTPTTVGVVDVLVKLYLPTEAGPGGQMSVALSKIAPGATLSIKGPIGRVTYSPSTSTVNLSTAPPKCVTSFTMVCAGSGITPIYQILSAALSLEGDAKCTLIYANRAETDILCKAELEKFSARSPDRFKLVYILSKPGDEWTGEKGRVDVALMQRVCEGMDNQVGMAMVCGPKGFEEVVGNALGELGWHGDRIVYF